MTCDEHCAKPKYLLSTLQAEYSQVRYIYMTQRGSYNCTLLSRREGMPRVGKRKRPEAAAAANAEVASIANE